MDPGQGGDSLKTGNMTAGHLLSPGDGFCHEWSVGSLRRHVMAWAASIAPAKIRETKERALSPSCCAILVRVSARQLSLWLGQCSDDLQL